MLQEQFHKFWGRQQNFGPLYQTDYSYVFIIEHPIPQENVPLKTGNLVRTIEIQSFSVTNFNSLHTTMLYSYAAKFCAVWAGGYKH